MIPHAPGVPDVPAPEWSKNPSVVALGGGHGLSASLSALRLMSDRLTAVVTVADDGGSSGRLRARGPLVSVSARDLGRE